MELYFVRHGESEANVLHIVSNRNLQHGLTTKGQQQAIALGNLFHHLPITKIYASPLLRALQTAEILSNHLNLPFITTDALREYDCGMIEGKSDAASWQLHRQLKEDWLLRGLWEKRIEGGESFLNIRDRFIPFIEKLIQDYGSTDAQILAIGHGGTFTCMLPLILENIDFAFALKQDFPNTSYIRAKLSNQQLICMNWCGVPCAHL